jgi:hypothetical protein
MLRTKAVPMSVAELPADLMQQKVIPRDRCTRAVAESRIDKALRRKEGPCLKLWLGGSSHSLPIPAPASRLRAVERGAANPLVRCAVIDPPHILAPRHRASVLVEILAADLRVLTEPGPTQAAEEALDLIGAGAVIGEGDAVVDRLGVERGVQIIPGAGLVCVEMVLPAVMQTRMTAVAAASWRRSIRLAL